MKSSITCFLAGLTLASAQGLDFAAIADAPPVPSADVPVVFVTSAGAPAITASVATYSASAVASSVAAAVSADPSNINLKRAATTSCVAQPTGYNYTPSPDTATQFLADTFFASQAANAPVPAGYSKTFTNLNGSNQAYGYLGYTTLTSYDPVTCAKKCDKIKGCMSVNLYFERDPSVNPDNANCSNPASVTQIKCVFWGGPVTKWNALNKGQWRNKFQVVIAGSNGYVNNTIALPAGYDPPTDLGTAAIDAPPDCSGHDTFLGIKLFTSGPYDPNLCLAACTAQSQYNVAHPPATGRPLTCQFFTTYLLYKNNLPVGQYCALYSKQWAATYATNVGMASGNDQYTIGSSYSFLNSTYSGDPYYPCDVASATSAIEQATLQPYCSTLLGYNSGATVTTTITPSPTAAASSSTTDGASAATTTAAPPPSLGSFDLLGGLLGGSITLGKVRRAAAGKVEVKRAIPATPAALTSFAPSAITSACSLEATGTVSTATVTVTASM